MLALGFFAGLRTSEIQGINWDCINFESKRIRIVPTVAKKRRQRFIGMQDNLIEWLLPYRQASGAVGVPFMTYRRGIDRVIKASDVKWVHNGMRHTFASCHLAKFQDMKRLVIEMGHADKADVLFGHYLDLVTPEDADRYWNIRPAQGKTVINP
jgi:integrase